MKSRFFKIHCLPQKNSFHIIAYIDYISFVQNRYKLTILANYIRNLNMAGKEELLIKFVYECLTRTSFSIHCQTLLNSFFSNNIRNFYIRTKVLLHKNDSLVYKNKALRYFHIRRCMAIKIPSCNQSEVVQGISGILS